MLSQLPFYLLLISLTLSLSNLADLIIPCLFSLLHSSHLLLDHLVLPSPFYILNIVPLHSKSVVVKECCLMNWVNVNSLLSIQGGSCSRRSTEQTVYWADVYWADVYWASTKRPFGPLSRLSPDCNRSSFRQPISLLKVNWWVQWFMYQISSRHRLRCS